MNYLYVIHAGNFLAHNTRDLGEAILQVKARRTIMMREGITTGSVKLTVLSQAVRGHGPYHHHHTMKFKV